MKYLLWLNMVVRMGIPGLRTDTRGKYPIVFDKDKHVAVYCVFMGFVENTRDTIYFNSMSVLTMRQLTSTSDVLSYCSLEISYVRANVVWTCDRNAAINGGNPNINTDAIHETCCDCSSGQFHLRSTFLLL